VTLNCPAAIIEKNPMSRSNYLGIYKVKNIKKYKGDVNRVVYRSSYEFKFMRYLDNHPNILEWSSEPFAIPYFCVVRKNNHRYFPDFWIKKKTIDNKIEIDVIEIKPFYETKPPVIAEGKTRSKTQLRAVTTYLINQSKWRAAQDFCKKNGWNFRILTEQDLGIK
jgi:hypothetical protein